MARTFPPTDERLDQLREMGDPPADRFVEQYFDFESVHPMMKALTARREVAREDVAHYSSRPDEIAAERLAGLYEETVAAMPDVSDEEIAIAQDLFGRYGPEILMILGCYSLPAAYAAEEGVQVLDTTKYLELQTERRLFETAQIIVDVMSGGLGPDQSGREAAQRTRLIHAAIRRLILEGDYDSSGLGEPINQEDLAATLMTFSWLVLDGLKKMNVRVTSRQAEAYIDTWRQVGRLMGVAEELLPKDVAEAEQLTEVIKERQIRASDTGRRLLEALSETLDAKTGSFGLPCMMMRLFLDPDLADDMGIKRNALPVVPDWAAHSFIRAAFSIDSWFLGFLGRRSMVLRDVSLEMLDNVMDWQGFMGSKQKFVLPESLDWYQARDDQKREKLSRIALDTALAGPRVGAAKRRDRQERVKSRAREMTQSSD